MLPCVCSVIDYKCRQDVRSTKKTAHEVECVTDVLMVKKQKVVNL